MIPTLIGCLMIAVLLVLAVVQVAKEEHEVHERQLAADRDELARLNAVVHTQHAANEVLRARIAELQRQKAAFWEWCNTHEGDDATP